MESELQISKARKVIRSLFRQSQKHNARMHKYALEDNNDRLRALDGVCGQCVNLGLNFRSMDGKEVVRLLCRKDHNPMILYQQTPFGQPASCDDFTQK